MGRIAIVGFGDMGERMAPHLLAAGHHVRVFDIEDSRLDAARRARFTVVASAAGAARGAAVILAKRAPDAREREIVLIGGALGDPGNHVVDVKRRLLARLREAAELATVVGPIRHPGAKRGRDSSESLLDAGAEPLRAQAQQRKQFGKAGEALSLSTLLRRESTDVVLPVE
jgi:hypothetical protein